MKCSSRAIGLTFLIFTLLLASFAPIHAGFPLAYAQEQTPALSGQVFIPLAFNPSRARVDLPSVPRINASHSMNMQGEVYYEQMSITWLGKVSSTSNYADIRVGYNETELYVDLAIFDRYLWYKQDPTREEMSHWDAASLYLNLDGNQGEAAGLKSFHFIAQLSSWEPRAAYQAVSQGTGSGWRNANLPFTTAGVWRGSVGPNNPGGDSRGWVARFYIPFSSLGLPGAPQEGTLWGMALVVHDRDSEADTHIPDQTWPSSIDGSRPSTWGQLQFGIPVYQAPVTSSGGTVVVRQGLNGAVVPDAGMGGNISSSADKTLCPGDANVIWGQWGNWNFAGMRSVVIQNQEDLSDWPCFAKYYVTFPLSQIPPGKVIRSAKLILHLIGGSDLERAEPSFLQVLMVDGDWSEGTINWNNAPMALQNISGRYVDPFQLPLVWPGTPIAWDISTAVALAYRQGIPLRLVVYSADTYQHSGKYFTTSDEGDWDAEGRPTLQVEWGNPK